MTQVVIVAGEESGDQHAAHFVRQLKQRNLDLKLTGIGGKHMQDAGVELISDLARYGVTGFIEVMRHMSVIRQAFKTLKKHLIQEQPRLLILVDYPGFNLRIAQFAKRHLRHTRIIYYISPQIWAWKAKRIHTIRRCVDHMAVIFPFEKLIYEQAGVPVTFVGHPLIDKLNKTYLTRQQLDLPSTKRLIALLPGSRVHEIDRHMPVMRDSAEELTKQLSDLHFVIPIARTVNQNHIEAYLKHVHFSYSLISEHAQDVIACCDVVTVASGTASLECALLEKPMCIIYRVSWLTYLIASQVIRVKYLGLCNLLANQMIVPELLQYDCDAIELTRTMLGLLTDLQGQKSMKNRLKRIATMLTQESERSIVDLIFDEIGE